MLEAMDRIVPATPEAPAYQAALFSPSVNIPIHKGLYVRNYHSDAM